MIPIKHNANEILKQLIENNIEQADGKEIHNLTGLSPGDINDAIAYLKDLNAVNVIAYLGTAPYDFGTVMVTSKSRFLYNELVLNGEIPLKESVGAATKLKWNSESNPDPKINSNEREIVSGISAYVVKNSNENVPDSPSPPSSNESVPPGNSEKGPFGEEKPSKNPLRIDPFAHADHTTQKDLLDFDAYSQSIAGFIISKKTEKPITIGIDAPWGMGKTNLMEMICWSLMRQEPTALRWCRKCGRCEKSKENDCGITADEAGAYWNENITRRGLPEGIMTIWFNAWKYDREESLWSALALEILRKIRQQSTILGRWKMAIDLNRARFDWEQLLYERLPKELLLGVTVLIIAFFASIINLYWTSHLFPEVLSNSIKGIGLPWFFLVLIAIVLTTFWDFYKRLVGPFDLNISQYIHEPNYRERIGFLSQFEDDFRNVIDIHASSVKTTIPP